MSVTLLERAAGLIPSPCQKGMERSVTTDIMTDLHAWLVAVINASRSSSS